MNFITYRVKINNLRPVMAHLKIKSFECKFKICALTFCTVVVVVPASADFWSHSKDSVAIVFQENHHFNFSITWALKSRRCMSINCYL